ncbi:MAG: carbamoyltransferase HypF [Hoeflea sp.]|uniref:carbamoyltransferase HypF n=1 Tax=Hoeflea sp. TaxID=1940281 RepID=UPI00329993FE
MDAASDRIGRRFRIRGLVQGVGFRPHVWRLATEEGLVGHVLNDGAGVEIEVWGSIAAQSRFKDRLSNEAPPLARIDSISWEALDQNPAAGGFRIIKSGGGEISTGVVPDAASCPACLADISDPSNRRFGYAFTNCTHCGPRLSIVHSIPYDRARTSMNAFPMCQECSREYEDPSDRRFHAQPNACAVCGPRLWLEDGNGEIDCDDLLLKVAGRIRDGEIVAIKGIGGFHLACDATSQTAVTKLRERKRRAAKPLAVMARDTSQIGRFCAVSAQEQELLHSSAAPVVVLRNDGEALAPGVAPGQIRTGFMLPYSPLHHLLMQALDRPIVLTSGNLCDEPQAIDNEDARLRLTGVADLWLMYDRDIINRLDDSVVRLDAPGPHILRRARGLAPAPLPLAAGFAGHSPVLAMGGELKSTFTLLQGGQAIVSQHLGDLEEAASHADYRKAITLYRNIFRFDAEVIAIDLHPDYLSSQWGAALAEETGARLVRVQHHHAHLASCLAEHGVEPGDDLTVGVVMDGLGFGADGSIWGGEFLLGGYDGFERAGHFAPVPLPGGAQAMREPWRNTVAHLHAAFGPDWFAQVSGTQLDAALAVRPLGVIGQMITQKLNSPLSSSAGRLFDAVAGTLGLCADRQQYEGQAAMEMEALATPCLAGTSGYPVAITRDKGAYVLSWTPLWEALIEDLSSGASPGTIAARFHLGLADALTDTAMRIAADAGVQRIVLSGGVMQNRILLEALHGRLQREGYTVLAHVRVPANDGGLSLGQAVIAAVQTR